MVLQNKMRCTATQRREAHPGPAGPLSGSLHATSLIDLPEGVLASILRRMPFVEKCRAQLVCKAFNNILARPMPGVWGRIPLHHKNTKSVSVSDLTRWLLSRVGGATSLVYAYKDGTEDVVRGISDEQHKRQQEIIMHLVPVVSGVMPHDATLYLNLTWAIAEALFSTEVESQPNPTQYTPSFQHQYWANLAGNLTHVHLAIGEHFGQETCAALNQLTRLQRLSLEAKSAFEEEGGPDEVEARIDLHLPQLLYFSVADFHRTTIAIDCPSLVSLVLSDLYPLAAFTGLPASLTHLSCKNLGQDEDTVVINDDFFASQQLLSLQDLLIFDCWWTDLAAVRQRCFSSQLTKLQMSLFNPAELFPAEAPWAGLPHNLQHLHLWFPLTDGLPVALEQLTNLRVLAFTRRGSTQAMKLTRPLDPFLDMPYLESLQFTGTIRYKANICCWTSDSLKLLGMAHKRIIDMQRAPGGRSIHLNYY